MTSKDKKKKENKDVQEEAKKPEKSSEVTEVTLSKEEYDALLKKVEELAIVNPDRLWLSGRSHTITPWHIYLDSREEAATDKPIGTTKRGIGPTYAAKASRTGIRLIDYIDPAKRQVWIDDMKKNPEL